VISGTVIPRAMMCVCINIGPIIGVKKAPLIIAITIRVTILVFLPRPLILKAKIAGNIMYMKKLTKKN
jgi:hypothetical protein